MSFASHGPHLLLVIGGAGVLAGGAVAQVRGSRRIAQLRRGGRPEDLIAAAELHAVRAIGARPGQPALRLAAAATGFAALTHAAVVPEHLVEATRFGLFFAVLAVVQAGAAMALLGRSVRRGLAVTIAAGNAAVVVLWVVSRNTLFPLGPEEVEHVGLLDGICSLSEVVAVAAVAAWWWVGRAPCVGDLRPLAVRTRVAGQASAGSRSS